MSTILVTIDPERAEKLRQLATIEKRRIPAQAAILLERALDQQAADGRAN